MHSPTSSTEASRVRMLTLTLKIANGNLCDEALTLGALVFLCEPASRGTGIRHSF